MRLNEIADINTPGAVSKRNQEIAAKAKAPTKDAKPLSKTKAGKRVKRMTKNILNVETPKGR